jgi:hypothetical protein
MTHFDSSMTIFSYCKQNCENTKTIIDISTIANSHKDTPKDTSKKSDDDSDTSSELSTDSYVSDIVDDLTNVPLSSDELEYEILFKHLRNFSEINKCNVCTFVKTYVHEIRTVTELEYYNTCRHLKIFKSITQNIPEYLGMDCGMYYRSKSGYTSCQWRSDLIVYHLMNSSDFGLKMNIYGLVLGSYELPVNAMELNTIGVDAYIEKYNIKESMFSKEFAKHIDANMQIFSTISDEIEITIDSLIRIMLRLFTMPLCEKLQIGVDLSTVEPDAEGLQKCNAVSEETLSNLMSGGLTITTRFSGSLIDYFATMIAETILYIQNCYNHIIPIDESQKMYYLFLQMYKLIDKEIDTLNSLMEYLYSKDGAYNGKKLREFAKIIYSMN